MTKKRITSNTNKEFRKQTNGIGANKGLLKQDDFIKFSYKYANLSHEVFHLTGRDASYFIHLIQRLHDLCKYRVSELKSTKDSTLRFHFIDWKDTTQTSFGLPNEEQLVEQPYQFSLSANKHGRIHGFFIDTVFYIVWFDPEHNLYA